MASIDGNAAWPENGWRFCYDSHNIEKVAPNSGVCWPGAGDIKFRTRVDVNGPDTLAVCRLISTAPRLYQALADLAYAVSSHSSPRDNLPEIEALLAEARGEQVTA